MNKTYNKSIILSLVIMAIFGLGATQALAEVCVQSSTHYCPPQSYTPTYYYPTQENTYQTNPIPEIFSLSPNSTLVGTSTVTISIRGFNFIQSSVVRFNGFDRPTNYIDGTHLTFQINNTDIFTPGSYPVTVFNPGPGGGYSNQSSFVVNPIVSNNIQNNQSSNSYNNTVDNSSSTTTKQTTNKNGVSALASNAIFGSAGLMPSGLVQWILFFILVLLIVVLFRKIFIHDDKPMKHA